MPDGAVMSGRGARRLDQAQADQHGETLKQAETAGDLPLNLPCRSLAPRRCSLQIVTHGERGGPVAELLVGTHPSIPLRNGAETTFPAAAAAGLGRGPADNARAG
jgi:hypothetical protein